MESLNEASSELEGSREVNLKEAARRLGVHYMTVYRYVRTGRLRASRRGGIWKVPLDGLAELHPELRCSRPGQESPTPQILEALVECLARGDERRFWSMLDVQLAGGSGPRLLTELVVEALLELRRGWGEEAWRSGQCQLAAAIATRSLVRISHRFGRLGRPRRPVLVGGTTLCGWHLVPLAAELLRQAGFDVLEVGAPVPLEALNDVLGTSQAVFCAVAAVDEHKDDDQLSQFARSGTEVIVWWPRPWDPTSPSRGGLVVSDDPREIVRVVENLWSGSRGLRKVSVSSSKSS
jgi:excisionase family DNA binding protein